MLTKINLGTCLIALMLFFFPWVDIQCSEKKLASQTGFQIANGHVTYDKDFIGESNKSNREEIPPPYESPASASLVGFAFFGILAGIVCSLIAIFRNLRLFESLGFSFPTIALGLLLLQIMVELPVKKQLRESIVEQSTDNASLDDPLSGMGNSSTALRMSRIQVKIRPEFYIELVVLGIPAVLLAANLISRAQKTRTSTSLGLP